MRTVAIVTTKSLYRPGDSVEGQLVVNSDKELTFKEVSMTFTGKERTEIVVQRGKIRENCKFEHVYFTNKQYMALRGIMPTGETKFPFSFTLPNDVPSSYSGKYAWNEYALKGIVEISRWFNPSDDIMLQVRRRMPEPGREVRSQARTEQGSTIFEAEMERNCVCLGDSIKIRYRVARDVKTRGVRAELLAEEQAITLEARRENKRTLANEFIKDREIQKDQWMNLEFKTDESMPVSFEGQIFRNRNSVKLTLDVPWAPDKSVLMPVMLGYCTRDSEGVRTERCA